MSDNILESIRSGWALAAASPSISDTTLEHCLVCQVDILIDDGSAFFDPSLTKSLGPARMVWVTPRSIRYRPDGTAFVSISKTSLSGANRNRRGSIRSVALLHLFHDEPERLEAAALLVCLVGYCNAVPDAWSRFGAAIGELLGILGFHCIQDIWARANSSPMPVGPPRSLRNIDPLSGCSLDLGVCLRLWHEISRRKYRSVLAAPVAGGPGTLDIDEFNAIAGRYSSGLNVAHGAREWKTLGREDLADIVWSEPRSHAMGRFGISDVAITKRCRREGISVPPRGYWQRMDADIDPRPLLDISGIRAPVWVEADLCMRFDTVSPGVRSR